MLGAADMSGDGRPEGDPERRALALAGDNQKAKQLAARLYNQFGFDTVDIGGLAESWRVDVGQPAFVTRQNVAELEANVAKARRALTPASPQCRTRERHSHRALSQAAERSPSGRRRSSAFWIVGGT